MKTVRDFNFKNKKVLLRADFNEPLKDGELTSDFRIKAVLPTIKYLVKEGAKVILLTHLGRPKGNMVKQLRVDPVGKRISRLLNKPVKKLNDCIGEKVEKEIKEMAAGDLILLENVQFHDGEIENSPDFVGSLANLADIFVMDAFGQSHRDYASISGLSKKMPSCAGLLLEKEVKVLSDVLNNADHPLVVIIGGVKISTKIKVIEKFLEKADDILLGGALANTVISAKGFAIGRSISEESMVKEVKKLQLTNTKLHIPVDVVVSTDPWGGADKRIAPVGNIGENEMILDIGIDTSYIFNKIISQAKTIIWNGPMGLFEVNKFAAGSQETARAIIRSKGFALAGGGDTITLLEQLGLMSKMDHISTGGGAMLEFLTGAKLPGIEALK
ncbi:MAG: phosphoglycerate kinase [Candidatus Portnoybacteria bacterium]|nr:phosphoglycerate kinase [Candidatus Portnoybacteria bacterium]